MLETSTKVATGSVINFTLNKDYDGGFYIVPSDKIDSYTNANANKIQRLTELTTTNSGSFYTVNKSSDFSDEELAKRVMAGSTGIKYVATDGTTSYKIYGAMRNGYQLERGKSYVLIFDQDDWIVSDAFTVPYLYAPDTLTVTDVQTQTNVKGWTATASFMGTQAGWLNAFDTDSVAVSLAAGTATSTANNNITTHLYYSNDDATTGETSFATDAGTAIMGKAYNNFTEGALSLLTNNNNSTIVAGDSKTYVYATMTIKKGIIGKDALTLTSSTGLQSIV